MLHRPCDGCDNPRVYLVSVSTDPADPLASIGACAAHLAAAYDRCLVLTETADMEDLEISVVRSPLAGDPEPGGLFAHVELAVVEQSC